MNQIKHIAIIQEPPAVLNLQQGVADAARYIRQAAKEGAQLIVFAETWLTGYPAWIFGKAAWDNADARYWYGRFLEECPTVDGDELTPIREAARQTGTVVSLGFNERARIGAGSIYNSSLLIGPDGSTLNLHRKLTPTHTERNVWAQGDASGLKVVPTDAGRIGSLICWENWQPMARQALHYQDEQIHIASWPDMPESHAIATRHYAFEGRCFVIAAAQYLTVADIPDELVEAYRSGVGNVTGDVLFNGGSAVAGPNAEWVGEQAYDKRAILHFQIDLTEAAQFKHDLDVVGHYSRSDIFTLSVDRSVREPVILNDTPPSQADILSDR
ncbi:MAG: carbon-nitrogen hydrolase family protein [Sulfitobacter sp.]